MKSQQVFRMLSIATFALALIHVLYYLQNVVYTYVDVTSSTLIPQNLWKHVAFTQLSLSVVFIGVGAYSYKCIKSKTYNSYMVCLLFICSVLFIFKGSYVYDFINSFNPYA